MTRSTDDLLVVADIHLGRKQSGEKKIGPGIGWALDTLERGARAGCTQLVVLGDVIDKKRYTWDTHDEVSALFVRALELFDATLFISGNHDTAHDLRGTIPPQVVVASPEPATYSLGGWALHTAAVDVDRDPRELVAGFPAPDPKRPNLGLLHTSLEGEWTNPCLPTTADELLSRGYGAWVLAHVHVPRVINTEPFIGYVGMGGALRVAADSGRVTVSPLDTADWRADN